MALQLCDQNVKTKQFVLHYLLLLRCNTSFAHQYLLSPFLGQVVPATLTKTITSRNGDHSNSIYIFILYFLFFHVKGKTEAATRGALYLEIFQNSQENTCARVSFLIKVQACNFIKNETKAQLFSSEFCKIFKNSFFIEHLRWLLLYRLCCQLLVKLRLSYLHKKSTFCKQLPEGVLCS